MFLTWNLGCKSRRVIEGESFQFAKDQVRQGPICHFHDAHEIDWTTNYKIENPHLISQPVLFLGFDDDDDDDGQSHCHQLNQSIKQSLWIFHAFDRHVITQQQKGKVIIIIVNKF